MEPRDQMYKSISKFFDQLTLLTLLGTNLLKDEMAKRKIKSQPPLHRRDRDEGE